MQPAIPGLQIAIQRTTSIPQPVLGAFAISLLLCFLRRCNTLKSDPLSFLSAIPSRSSLAAATSSIPNHRRRPAPRSTSFRIPSRSSLYDPFPLLSSRRHLVPKSSTPPLPTPPPSARTSVGPSVGAQHLRHRRRVLWLNPLLHLPSHGAANTTNSLSLVLCKWFLREIMISGLYAFVRTLAIAFIRYSYHEERDLRIGLSLDGCLLLIMLVESLSQRHWFFDSRRTGMRIRSALMAVIFQKQLKLSSQGRKNHSTGKIVNYIAVDAYCLILLPNLNAEEVQT